MKSIATVTAISLWTATLGCYNPDSAPGMGPGQSEAGSAVTADESATETTDDGASDGLASDTTAPGETGSDGADQADGESGSDPLTIDCAALPLGAVGASFSAVVSAAGGDSPYQFSAVSIPDGLELDPSSGTLSGVPTTSGWAAFELAVTDASGAVATTDCAVDIAARLAVVPLELDTSPYCLTGADTVLAHVEPDSGDGTPITCHFAGASGDGKLPAGISIDPDTCAAVGVPAETRLGTWAFIVRATQSGAEVFMPYCITNPTPAMDTFDITVDHSGSTEQTFVPLVRTFDPDAPVIVEAAGDALFTIVDDEACAPFPGSGLQCNLYGYELTPTSSPLSAETVDLAPTAYVLDAGDMRAGFSHTLRANGPVVPEAYKTRPWVVNLELDYCLSSGDNGGDVGGDPLVSCEPGPGFGMDAHGFLAFSLVMVPVQP